MGFWKYIKGIFYRPNMAEYLEQNLFYERGCARHFNESFERGIIQGAINSAERELVLPGSCITDLLDALFLRRKISSMAWRTYSAAASPDGLADKLKNPKFTGIMEEEIIKEIMQQT
ncbi:hypothetical protein KY329_04085 [Candidatus Woesearchaeota archaeon]|nr:hypothetical protein [Candidatus Woesearchaeota archaeon]